MTALKIFLLFNALAICCVRSYNQNLNDISDRYNVEEADIERPCEVFDKFCIRKYFEEHSHCKAVDGPVPDPLYRDQTTSYLPHVNVTFIVNNLIYRGLNGLIEEFYINHKTDRLVLAVEFRNVTTVSDSVNIRFHRKGQEPIVTQDSAGILFKSVIVTIIIPNLQDLQLGRAEVYSYVNEAMPVLTIGPKAFDSTDPSVLQVYAEFMTTVPITVQEAQLTEGPFYIGTFVQYNICDFGLAVL